MNVRAWISGLLVAGVSIPASAAVVFQSRTTTTTIHLGNTATLAGASFDYANLVTFSSDPGESIAITLSTSGNATNISTSAGGGASVTPSSVPNGTPQANLTLTGNAVSGGGSWQFGYQGTAGTAAGSSFIVYDSVNNRYALDFAAGGSNFVTPGGTFTSTLAIDGDWSAPSSHSAISFGAGYTLVDDFVFSGGVTRVTVKTTNYDNTNPGIVFSLLGAQVVPEPGSLALVAVAPP